MRRFGDGAAKLVLLAGSLMLAGCAVAPLGPDYGYGAAPGSYGYYDDGYASGFGEPGYAGAFCCFDAEPRHDHDQHRHRNEMPPARAVAHHPFTPRTASGSSQPRPGAAPLAHAPPHAGARRGPVGHASASHGHAAAHPSSGGGPDHRP